MTKHETDGLAAFYQMMSGMDGHTKLEFKLLMAALDMTGTILKMASDGFNSAERGEVPTFDLGPSKRKLLKAACDFAKDGTYKPKAKRKKKA